MVNKNTYHSNFNSFNIHCSLKDNYYIDESEFTNTKFPFIPVSQDIYRIERRFK